MSHDLTVATGSAEEVPDFASLYGDPTSKLSPRLAAYLWAAAGVLSDNYRGPGGRKRAPGSGECQIVGAEERSAGVTLAASVGRC